MCVEDESVEELSDEGDVFSGVVVVDGEDEDVFGGGVREVVDDVKDL